MNSEELWEAHQRLQAAHLIYQEAIRALLAQSEKAYQEALEWSANNRKEIEE
jgi:predicted metal-dependent hydrolase